MVETSELTPKLAEEEIQETQEVFENFRSFAHGRIFRTLQQNDV
jgi:hypothetical protein